MDPDQNETEQPDRLGIQRAPTKIMNTQLNTFIKQYIELEQCVQELALKHCLPLCQQCGVCCCDALLCEEAIESPFLKLVHQQTDEFSPSHGFLSETGCILRQGRPPVCYAYFCADIIYCQPDELHVEILQVLGALPNHATHNALGDRPLAEIFSEEEFDQLDYAGLERQFKESFHALDIIRTFYTEGTLSDTSYHLLKQIQFIPQ
jgi:hypothetical protein